jgi:NAD(P)-dependent dehydrogenase (short-subunit alcohol dehydrogenase family)
VSEDESSEDFEAEYEPAVDEEAPAPEPTMRVLVTGASGGIGRAVVKALSARGAAVLAQGRSGRALEALANEAPGTVALPCELLRPIEQRALVRDAWEILGGLDALVQCAGMAKHQPALEIDPRTLEETFALNTFVPILLAREFASTLIKHRREGAIVSVSSTLASRPAPNTLVYAASKAALDQAMRTLALELAPKAIRVSVVSPGIVATPMVGGRDAAHLLALHPIGRLGTPEEVAQAILYLLEARWATGTVLVLDGGLTLRE